MIEMLVSHKGLSDEEIAALEERMNVKLPQQYKNFLKETNGGYPLKSLHNIKGLPGNEIVVVNVFCSVKDKYDDLEEVNSDLQEILPEGFISIADDPGGHQFLLGLCGSLYEGQVHFFLHDLYVPTPMDATFAIAENFDKFLSGLFYYED